MSATIAPVVIFLGMLVVLCVPPALLIVAAPRRMRKLDAARAEKLRRLMPAVWMALAFNAWVCVVEVPRFGATDAGFGTIHMLALGVAWVCLWAVVAMPALLPRRRKQAA